MVSEFQNTTIHIVIFVSVRYIAIVVQVNKKMLQTSYTSTLICINTFTEGPWIYSSYSLNLECTFYCIIFVNLILFTPPPQCLYGTKRGNQQVRKCTHSLTIQTRSPEFVFGSSDVRVVWDQWPLCGRDRHLSTWAMTSSLCILQMLARLTGNSLRVDSPSGHFRSQNVYRSLCKIPVIFVRFQPKLECADNF
jgi:hypothetical protein